MQKKKRTGIGGLTANAIILPFEVVLCMFLILIVILVFEVNRSSNKLTDMMEKSSVYQRQSTEMQAGISILSETVSNYAQTPALEDGSANVGPLMAYAQELANDRRGPQIAERFRGYGVSSEVQSCIDSASEISEQMFEIQTRVIALLRSVYPLPAIPALSAIPDVALTEEEQAMPAEDRVGYAKRMILGQEYAQLKYHFTEDIDNSHSALQADFSRAAAATRHHIGTLRTALWVVIACIIALLFFGIAILRAWMIRPLRKHVLEINADQSMRQVSRVQEMRILVSAYNELLVRRNKLETILRSAAETDSLTGLPNRYSMEHYLLESGEDDSSMAVVVFDVNYLKQTNDTSGHMEGDKLLRTAGDCIRECFSNEKGDNCYRIGGDEFTAILRGCDEENIRDRLNRFDLALEREHISVSVGYAFADRTDEDTFQKLLSEADRRMYKEKKQIHESGRE